MLEAMKWLPGQPEHLMVSWLDKPLIFPQASRVELTVTPSRSWSDFIDALDALGSEQPIGSGGVRQTRDELHERR